MEKVERYLPVIQIYHITTLTLLLVLGIVLMPDVVNGQSSCESKGVFTVTATSSKLINGGCVSPTNCGPNPGLNNEPSLKRKANAVCRELDCEEDGDRCQPVLKWIFGTYTCETIVPGLIRCTLTSKAEYECDCESRLAGGIPGISPWGLMLIVFTFLVIGGTIIIRYYGVKY